MAVRRWTQAETVARFGFSRGSYRGYFQTCETPPTLPVVVKVADAFGITPAELMQRVEARIASTAARSHPTEGEGHDD